MSQHLSITQRKKSLSTCNVVSETDGGERDKGKIDSFVKGPSLEEHEQSSRQENEDTETRN